MKRKSLITILSLIGVLCLSFGLAACGDTTTPDDRSGTHSHSYVWTDNGDGTHNGHCSVSGCDQPDINNESHVWGTDGKCTKCKVVKPNDNPPAHSHEWSTEWTNDDTHHWHNCTAENCNITDNAQKDGYAAHDFSNGNCVCGKIAPHVHAWSTEWTNDDTHHWHNCTAEDCNITDNAQKDGYAAHDFSNGNCVCGKIAPHVHAWSTEWETTATRHWHNCTAEGCPITSILEKDGYAAHDFSNNGICICGKSRELNYVLNSDNESYSVKGIGSIISSNVEIPAEYDGKPVTAIKNYAFENCGIKNLTIGRNVTSIGKGAFDGCGSMESISVDENNTLYASQDGILYNKAKTEFVHIPAVLKGEITIPDGVERIKEHAFRARNITALTIGSGVTNIGEMAFCDSKQLTTVTLPDGIKVIGYYAFDGCNKLQFTEYENACYLGNSLNPYLALIKAKDANISSCTINEAAKIIADSAFSSCKSLTSITIPDGITNIGESAFEYCDALSAVKIGNGVEVIKAKTFNFCSKLTTVTIGSNVKYILNNSFTGCGFTSITFEGTRAQWLAIDKYPDWRSKKSPCIISCSDGDITET